MPEKSSLVCDSFYNKGFINSNVSKIEVLDSNDDDLKRF